MTTRDIYRFINELDDTATQRIIDRLEFRGKDLTFSRWRDDYLDKLSWASASILDLGCGTGVVARTLAKRKDFSGRAIGVDQSMALIEAARRFATGEGVDEQVKFQTGDVHHLDFADAHFDIVIAHTLLSHVTEPLTVIKEAARVVRPGGMVALFDGDYASLTFAASDPALAKPVEEALIGLIVNNPRVMRDLPRLLRQAGLELVEATAHVYADIGTGSFWPGAVETYGPMLARSGRLPTEQVDAWMAEQRQARNDGTFFGASNYYTYLAKRPQPI